mmetsp:Transcript_3993/g.15935  ORF Transcript_3993/g.15935 Transcript_3993/m.15935 type:complete len:196 (-) Transcript_3993:128-715(-)
MLRVRRNAGKIAAMRREARDLAEAAEEAVRVAEKTARLTALDLDVVDYLEEAEDAAARAVAKRDRLLLAQREAVSVSEGSTSSRSADAVLAAAEKEVVEAQQALAAAKAQALDVARRIVESKEAIVAEVLDGVASGLGGGGGIVAAPAEDPGRPVLLASEDDDDDDPSSQRVLVASGTSSSSSSSETKSSETPAV